jgi:hypothetical protein
MNDSWNTETSKTLAGQHNRTNWVEISAKLINLPKAKQVIRRIGSNITNPWDKDGWRR